jgi:hypothetical protein
MKEVTIQLFEFDELEEKIQDEIVEKSNDINVYSDWYECVYEMWKGKPAQIGFEDVEIQFSGFWSQGDGASFTGSISWDRNVEFIRALKLDAPEIKRLIWYIQHGKTDISIYVVRTSHHYAHARTVEARVDIDGVYSENLDLDERVEKAVKLLRDEFADWLYQTCQEIYHDLEKEYEYLTSREAIVETIKVNEHLFTAQGVPEWRFR